MTETTHLLNFGDFTLASGLKSDFKIDCDFLADEDIETVAKKAALMVGRFGKVYGVPTGGNRLAAALEKYADDFSSRILIVDDVLTTGNSIQKLYDEKADTYPYDVAVFVIFTRINSLRLNNYRDTEISYLFHL